MKASGRQHVVILIFSSGRLVIAGAKRQVEVNLAAEKLKETLNKNGLISYGESSTLRIVSDRAESMLQSLQ